MTFVRQSICAYAALALLVALGTFSQVTHADDPPGVEELHSIPVLNPANTKPTTSAEPHGPSPSAAGSHPSCDHPQRSFTDPFFKDVHTIVLSIGVIYKPLEVEECRKQPAECTQMSKNGGLFSRSPEFLRALHDPSRGYPEALYPEALEAVFRPLIETNWLPYLDRDPLCNVPKLTVFSADFAPLFSNALVDYENNKHKAESAPDALTVSLNVTVDEKLAQHIAVVTYTVSRSTGYSQSHLIAAISLPDTANEEISRIIHDFAEHTVRLPDSH